MSAKKSVTTSDGRKARKTVIKTTVKPGNKGAVNKPLFAKSLLAAVILAVGCDSDSGNQVIVREGEAALAFRAPLQLITTDNVVEENLVLRVTIGDTVTTILPDENNEYTLTTELSENSSTTVVLEWLERIGDELLPLAATAPKRINAGTRNSPASVVFFEDEYDTSLDNDNDQFSNLIERGENTGFNDPLSPARTR